MNKVKKTIMALVLSLCLVISFAVPSFAAGKTVRLSTADDVLKLAEDCRTDTYSDGLTVELLCDIDLSGTDFGGIPTFGGEFNGNGFTVSGLNITEEGSVQGFFRYLRASAVVNSLNIKGDVIPSGSAASTGGIVGSNEGKVKDCSFEGEVGGSDRVGGIAGENKVTGVITGCQVHGSVNGKHFVGGITGANEGTVRGSKNAADINTTAVSNTVELTDITLESITDTEAANTVTDIGGIAGINSGVIRAGVNYGNVGYKLMGYNVGGIAGSHSGYMTSCINYGQIFGRKDVGGIAGQMEPVTNIEYSTDTLQILEGQMSTLGTLTDRAAANAKSSADAVAGQVNRLKNQAESAKGALDVLTPDIDGNIEIPDRDTILAAQSTLSESLTAMPGTIDSITNAVENAAHGISRDMQAVSAQMGVIGQTVNNGAENLGVSITDASDSDTENDLLGKVENCSNHGNVSGDGNIGGIAGTIAFENDLAPDEDVEVFGEMSLNFASEIRAVILNCQNKAEISAKKQRVGGIIGWQSLGLVKDCTSIGDIFGSTASYVGGIAGQSSGFLRNLSAKCFVYGDSFAGGIAGEGKIVTNCRSMVSLEGNEKTGAVLGYADAIFSQESESPDIFGNCYLAVNGDIGAVDGISYTGLAEAKSKTEFFALEGVPAEFRTVTVKFIFDDGRSEIIQLPHGEALDESLIPEIPEKDGYTGRWNGLETAEIEEINFDTAFYTEYEKKARVIESEETDENGRPILFAQGMFGPDSKIESKALLEELGSSDTGEYIAGRSFTVTDGSVTALRFLIGSEYKDEEVYVILASSDGSAREEKCRTEGSYAVFEVEEDDKAFAVFHQEKSYVLEIAAAAAAVLIIVLIVVFAKRKKKKAADSK